MGSIRRECLDHGVVFGESHLRHLLRSYMHYYNAARTHLSLGQGRRPYRGLFRSSDTLCRHQFSANGSNCEISKHLIWPTALKAVLWHITAFPRISPPQIACISPTMGR